MEIFPPYLERAYTDGESDVKAGEQMLYASHLVGTCENFAGFSPIHSLAEAIGGMYPGISHGEVIGK